MPGKATWMSTSRISTLSMRPPMKPAHSPTATPKLLSQLSAAGQKRILAEMTQDVVVNNKSPEEAMKALAENPVLRDMEKNDERVRELLSVARRLEGMTRHASVHAAGVVIAPRPLTEFVPLYKSQKDEIVTQWAMKEIERMGLLKMDFLGLSTLTLLTDVQEIDRQVPLLAASRKAYLETEGELDQVPREIGTNLRKRRHHRLALASIDGLKHLQPDSVAVAADRLGGRLCSLPRAGSACGRFCHG